MGHLKEACPYTIHKGMGSANVVDSAEISMVGEDGSCNGHDANRTDPCSKVASIATSGTSGVEKDSDLYGPWMVVARRRNGHKGTKHTPTTTEGTTKPVWQHKDTRTEATRGGSSLSQRDVDFQAHFSASNNTSKRAHGAQSFRPSPEHFSLPKDQFGSNVPARSALAPNRVQAQKKRATSV